MNSNVNMVFTDFVVRHVDVSLHQFVDIIPIVILLGVVNARQFRDCSFREDQQAVSLLHRFQLQLKKQVRVPVIVLIAFSIGVDGDVEYFLVLSFDREFHGVINEEFFVLVVVQCVSVISFIQGLITKLRK